ncbi:integrase core domain-containing protein, partial [Metapseudomonas otitidis]
GKDERFHRSLKLEVLKGRHFHDLAEAQSAFDRWREIYNQQRPHEALSYQVPINRYRTSPWKYPEQPTEFEYG